MSEDIIIEKLEKVFYECDKHILRINSAVKKMSNFMPLYKDRYENLTDEEVEPIDQFLLDLQNFKMLWGKSFLKLY